MNAIQHLRAGLLLLLCLAGTTAACSSRKEDSLAAPNPARAPDLTNRLSLDAYGTLGGAHFANMEPPAGPSYLSAYANTIISNELSARLFSVNSYLFAEFGGSWYPDSTLAKTHDSYLLRQSLRSAPFAKHLVLNASMEWRSQLAAGYAFRTDDTGGLLRYRESDYLSPGNKIFALGLAWTSAGCSLELGAVGGKIVRIRDQRLYDEGRTEEIRGVRKGERRKLEYGFSLNLAIPPQMLGRHFGLDATATVFTPYKTAGRLASWTADAGAGFHYLFLRHFRISLRCRLRYNEQVDRRVGWTNSLTLGCYISNKL